MKINTPSAKFILSIIILFVPLFHGCNSSATSPAVNSGTKDFPNTVGDEWQYFYYDSLSHSADTVVVTITGDTTFRGDRTATIWRYTFSDRTEYRYVEISEDTVKIFPSLKVLWDNTKFIFPLTINKSWTGDAWAMIDTSSVLGKKALTTKAGNFENVYVIQEDISGPNTVIKITTGFVPGIGMVKQHKFMGYMTFANEYWELMAYTLK